MAFDVSRLRALFPSLYSRREPRPGEPTEEPDRAWSTLAVGRTTGRLRVVGPNWSVACILARRRGGRALALDTLAESEVPADSAISGLRRPTVLRATISDLWRGAQAAASLSRLSLIAIDTDNGGFPSLPLPGSTSLNGYAFDSERTSELLLDTIGRFPRNRSLASTNVDTIFLPATRLLAGEIWFQPVNGYLGKARAALRLGPPDERVIPADLASKIALLPDGVAIAGSIALPWRTDTLSAWFRISVGGDERRERTAMQLWRTPIADWQGALDELEEILGTSAGSNGPRWLAMRAGYNIAPQALSWPLGTTAQILLRRSQVDETAKVVHVRSDNLVTTLGSAPDGTESVLTLRPAEFRVAAEGATGLVITSAATTATPSPGAYLKADATYVFDTARAARETLTLDQDGHPLRLSVPMLSNAERLRREMAFAPPAFNPDWGSTEANWLWLFTAVDGGWLHWPFPNATLPLLAAVVAGRPEVEDPIASVGPGGSSGSWRLGAGTGERAWSILISGAEEAEVAATFERNGSTWALSRAKVVSRRLSMRFDGILPVTPFVQTTDRLLPDAPERALRHAGLDAVTPDLLRGTEWQAWNVPSDSALRVTATIANLVLQPPDASGAPVRFDAAARLRLETLWPAAGVPHPGGGTDTRKHGEMRPWLWLRHGSLPAVQIMPLAAAGAAAREPSGVRELAPLRRLAADAPLVIGFAVPFEMTSSTIGIHPPDTGTFERPRIRSIVKPSARDRIDADSESADVRPIDDVGMAITTLPSLTLFPGQSNPRSFALADLTWNAAPLAVAVEAEVRHDLALCDEGFAFATVPPPPRDQDAAEDDAPPEPDATFAPLPFNAPDTETRSAWSSVWAARIRSHALATAADNRLVARKDGGHELASVFHGQSIALSGAEFDGAIVIEEADPEADLDETAAKVRLTHAGRLTLVPATGAGPTQELLGLPATGDLMGLHGTFRRPAGTGRLLLGSLAAEADARRRFLDQGGVVSEPPMHAGDLVRRRVDARHELVTLSEAIAVDRSGGAPAALFHFRDVPMPLPSLESDLAGAWYDDAASERGLDGAANSTQVDRNHLAGFAWALSEEPAQAPGHLAFGPFLFEPLALVEVKLTSDRNGLASAVIGGRIKLLLDGRPVSASGPVDLKLERSGPALSWSLAARPARSDPGVLAIPLADPELANPELADAGAPLLVVAGLSLTEHTITVKAAALRFTAGGRAIERELRVPTRTGDGIEFKDQLDKTDTGFAGALVRLFDDGAAPEVSARLFLAIGPGHAQLRLGDSFKLAGEPPIISASTCTFGGMTLAVTPKISLDGHIVAVEWQADVGGTLMGGLAVEQGARGSALALLAPDSFAVLDARATIRLRAEVPTDKPGFLDISFDATRPGDQGTTRISGTLAVADDYLWPAPTLEQSADDPPLVLGDVGAGGERFRHEMTIAFASAPVDLAQLAAGDVHLAANVKHKVSHPGGGTVEWSAHQIVRLSSPTAAMARLKKIQTSGDIVVLSGSRSTGDANIARVAAAMISGLSVDLAKALQAALQAALDTAARSIVLDTSAHHFLFLTDAGGERLVHVPLPALAALGTEDWFTVAAPGARLVRRLDPAIVPGFPTLRPDHKARLKSRRAAAAAAAVQRGTDIASELVTTGAKLRHEATFAGETALVGKENTTLDPVHPWADQSMRLGLLFARLAAGGIVDPSGLTLAPNGWADMELVSEALVRNGVPIYKTAPYRAVWSDKLLGDPLTFVPGPEEARGKVSPPSSTITLIAPAASGRSLAIAATVTVEEPPSHDHIVGWARATLARAAPSAMVGLVVVRSLASGVPLIGETFIITSISPRFDRPQQVASVRDEARAPQGQRQAQAARGSAPPGVLDGFCPLLTRAEVLMDAAGAVDADGGTTVALTASSAVTGFGLAGSAGRLLEPPDSRFWLSDRDVMPFRPFTTAPASGAAQVTFALPEATTARLPAALLPGRTGRFAAPPDPPGAPRGYLPSSHILSAVGVRAGVWMARRLGIDAYADGAATAHSALETPLWLRTPRPVELGVDDRTRTSSHEADTHMSLTPYPVAILHGPARALAPFETSIRVPGRPPRSTDAMTVKVDGPERGLLGADWDGRIVLSVVAAFNPPERPAWTIEKATLWIGRAVYRPKTFSAEIGPDAPAVLADFQSSSNERAPDAVAAVAAGTAATLGLLVKREGLVRRLRFDLRSAGRRALLETPMFIRFVDPAYDDQLTGCPKPIGRPIPATGYDLVLVAERGEVRPDDFVEVGLALRRNGEAPPVPLPVHFSDQHGAHLVIDGTPHPITIEAARRRSGETPVTLGRTYVPRVDAGDLPFLNIAQDFAEVADDLRERDQIAITAEVLGLHLLTLLDVTERPQLPANTSAYALLRLDGADAAVTRAAPLNGSPGSKLSVPLYARGARPTLVELVDPREMVYGAVRRRAHYIWSTLVPRREGSVFALQKSAGVGATWLTGDLDAQWRHFD
ncbi:hypothetical protein [Bradyrhizobium diversitatis]|uniref:Uncharacterized protein n=1 Tax=Bradyrhizobium diversitatis TaxID=2755406 RepID=A0ABS0P081_9BRAD|nr:hypothetical protein [Bradyrhizobium diversitatis]MBH5386661.1 hypothetical protein [Bradyrhizobium diversitatis]